MKLNANKKTAFLAGFSIAFLVFTIDLSYKEQLIQFNSESGTIFPLLAGYFIFSAIVFVLGVENIIKLLELRGHFNFWPPTKEYSKVIYGAWLRILMWFIGVTLSFLIFLPYS